MDKWTVIHSFWNSHGLPAYDENTVPDDAEMPYITYEARTGSIGDAVTLSASLWYHSMSWEAISKKSEEIGDAIVRMSPPSIAIDGGRAYISKATPFARRMDDPDGSIRRIIMNVNVEFFTN